jgi:tetratricopeptide (TPR) repeat protein
VSAAGRRQPGRLWLLAAALALLTAAGFASSTATAARRADERMAPLLYLPSGRYLKAASLGFDAILADVLYLWSIQYYSNYRIEDRYSYLEHIYRDVITELDPRYVDPYLVGALIMTAEARQPEMALRLLDKGIERNPGDWILPFEAGYVCYRELRDYARAARYFEIALRSPLVHPAVRRFHAATYSRAGDARASLREWASIGETTDDPYVRAIAWNHVHDLHVEVDLEALNAAIARFVAERGRKPARLEDLVSGGLLAALPADPEGGSYAYDHARGEASYRGSRVLGR